MAQDCFQLLLVQIPVRKINCRFEYAGGIRLPYIRGDLYPAFNPKFTGNVQNFLVADICKSALGPFNNENQIQIMDYIAEGTGAPNYGQQNPCCDIA